MNKIKKFNQFVTAIYELDTSDTYLDPKKRQTFEKPKEKTELQKKMSSNIFKSAPKTTGKSYGFKFEKDSSDRHSEIYKVVFPSNFLEHFQVEDNSFWNWIFGQKKKKPIKVKTSDSTVLYNLANKGKIKETDVQAQASIQELLDERIFIQIEKKYNRIHFPGGIPQELHGIGLGYIIYEEFIKFLGYGSSDKQMSSNDAKNIWYKITNDPDFYCIMVHNANEYANSKVLAISKNHPIMSSTHKNKLDKIIISFLKDNVLSSDINTSLRVDEELEKKLPYLTTWKQIYDKGFSLEDWLQELDSVLTKMIDLNKLPKDISPNQYEKLGSVINVFKSSVVYAKIYSIEELEKNHNKFEIIYKKLVQNFDEEKQNEKFRTTMLFKLLKETLHQILYERHTLDKINHLNLDLMILPLEGETSNVKAKVIPFDLQ